MAGSAPAPSTLLLILVLSIDSTVSFTGPTLPLPAALPTSSPRCRGPVPPPRLRRGAGCVREAAMSGGTGGLLDWERERANEEDDARFYYSPRLVYHADHSLLGRLNAAYKALLPRGGDVVDLMSSWTSHLGEVELGNVAGLGLNADELRCNPHLDTWVVHDMNANTTLPYSNDSFDAALICMGIQYLVDPESVLADIRRILRPGGILAVSWSGHCFQEKATRGWLTRDQATRIALLRQLLARAGFGHVTFHEDYVKSDFVGEDELFLVSARTPTSAGQESAADSAQGVGEEGSEQREEGGEVLEGVQMTFSVPPDSPIVWQDRFNALVVEAAGLGIPPEALAKYDPTKKEMEEGGDGPSVEEFKEAMVLVQNVIASRLSSNL